MTPLDHYDPATFLLFAQAVTSRLRAGAVTYGDDSFAADPAELLAELQQECLDLAGWGFVLWCRLERMRRAAEPIDPHLNLQRPKE